jgi:hypothetical protein
MDTNKPFLRNFSYRGWLENFAFLLVAIMIGDVVSVLWDSHLPILDAFTSKKIIKNVAFAVAFGWIMTVWNGSFSRYKRGD